MNKQHPKMSEEDKERFKTKMAELNRKMPKRDDGDTSV